MNKYICLNCNKEYTSRKKNSKFCSIECKHQYNRVEYNCDYCGVPMIVYRNKYEKLLNGERKGIYCSKDCHDKSQITKIEKTCECCNKKFFVSKCCEDTQKYCSQDCYQKVKAKKIKLEEKTCPVCNNKFNTYHHNQIFCSKECCGISGRNRKVCICENCGKEFERIVSEVDKNKTHYCSNECRIEGIRWSVSDISILRENYRKVKTKEIQKMLSKYYSLKAIRSRAKDYGFSKTRLWTKDEENIVINNYEHVSLSNMMKLLPNRTLPSIMHKAREYNLLSNSYLKNTYSKNDIKFLTNNYLQLSNEELAHILNRTPNAIAQKLLNLSLYRPLEIKKDGYKGLTQFMRSRLSIWKDEVRKQFNYTCALSGSRSNIVVHHCHGFNLLFEETIDALDFPILDNFCDYTDEQLFMFVDTFLKLQEYHNAYVCISENIHKLFHTEYGYGDNTIEQWEEFKQRYRNNEFMKIA